MEFYSPMLFVKKHSILILIILSGLNGQIEDKKKTKTFLFGLIKFDTESAYEKGAWSDKWLHAREFATPVKIIPVELRYGFGFSGKTIGSPTDLSEDSATDDPDKIKYEEDVELIDQGFRNLWGSSLELDLGLINIPYFIMKTSWMNVLTGITYRTNQRVFAAEVPYAEWGQTNANWSELKYFSPKTTELLLTNHFQYQPFNHWYLNFRYSYGYASVRIYSSDQETWDDSPTGSGTSMALGSGLRFILDPGKENRFSLGVDFRYSYTKIHTIDDPNDITPISRFDLSNYGLYFTLSAFYGGRLSAGDEGKKLYYRKDYIEAKKKFKKFLAKYPAHANRYKAEEYLAKCEYKIPYQIMDEGVVLDDQVKTGKALSKYLKARSLAINDTLITKSLDHRIDQIARLWMHKADMMLEEYRYDDAYDLVKRVAKFSYHGKKAIRRFKSYTILGDGKEYQAGGFIGKAMGKYSEALELNADLIYEVNALQYQAGIQMANLAAKADEFEEIQLAIYSLEYARSLAGGIGNKNEQLLTDLKKRLKALDDYKIRTVIDYKMNLARVEQALARTDRLEIGQTIPQVQELLGDPHEKVLGDNGENPEEQLWIYFVNDGTFQLSFQNYQLFKIEEI